MPDLLDRLKKALEGRYEIERELGQGGMATVFLARDLKHPRPVAIKVLNPELAAVVGAERFLHEIETTASLTHPHILPLLDSGEADGLLFYVMPFIAGQSLRDRLTREEQLPIEDALRIVRDVASALDYAHRQGILHRDVKPENILLSEGEAVVADFGIARAIHVAGGKALTQTGLVVGTPAYMSPEQASGSGSLDSRSDIYSLGCVLYEMLAGETPFTGPTAQAITSKRLTEPVPRLSAVRETVPETVEQAVTKALSKVPADRYATPAKFAEALGVRLETPPRGVVERKSSRRSLAIAVGAGALVTIAAVLLVILKPFQSENTPDQRTGPVKLAVLPFENLGASEDEYFADGVTDEITSRLAVIPGLAVISRTSAKKYKNTDKGLREIGQELGVDYVLEGTIRWDKKGEVERVRITPQLINVSDDFHLWAENYEREIEEIFAVQADIASQIAEALDITLLESERQSLEAKPTENLDAYQAYLRGLDYIGEVDRAKVDVQLGIQLLERAVELDPEFALSYAALSKAHSLMHHRGHDRTEERLSRAKAAVDKALELQPELPEAHLAFSYYYYYGYRDYERALEELAIAERGLPNDGQILSATANIWRRQGKFEAAVDRRKKAFELSPQDASLAFEIGVTYQVLRRYAEADRYYDLSISLAPDQQWAYGNKAYNYISWLGDMNRARDVLEKMPGKSREVQEWSLELWRLERNYQVILDFASSDSRPIIWGQMYVGTPALLAARAHQLMGEPELAHASYDSARAILEKELDARPDDHRIHSALGFAYAGLGRKEVAIREGKRGVELIPISKDALRGISRVWDLAEIYTMVGKYDAALDEIEYLLSIPSWRSVQDLRLHPKWDPLRDDPRFQTLLEKYGGVG